MSDSVEPWVLRQLAIIVLDTMLVRPVANIPDGVRIYIATRLLPILMNEEAAAQGRPGARRAGETVQAFIGSGMSQRDARHLVAQRTGLKYASVAKAHQAFLKTGKRAMLYATTIQPR